MTPTRTSDNTVPDRYSVPGHDRDCARAMWSQARPGREPLDQVQVKHLLMIGWKAGATAEHDLLYEGVTEDCCEVFDYAKAIAQDGFSRELFAEAIARVYGPTMPWRRRVRLAAYLVFQRRFR